MILTDRLIFIEYRDHHAQWINDGRPRGHFWAAPEIRWGRLNFLSTISFYRLNWIYRTPAWISGDARARKILLTLRLLYVPYILLFVWIAYAFFTA